MNSHGERLDERTLLKSDVCRELVAVIFRQFVVFGQASVGVRRSSRELHISTEIVTAFSTSHTESARNAWFQSDFVSGKKRPHGWSNGMNYSSGFVTHDKWRFRGNHQPHSTV